MDSRISPTRYRLYIDESGDHTYKLLDDPSHRYLALFGVWFRQHDHYTQFADDLESFKRDIFGPRPDKPVILHRSDILNRKGPFGLLSAPEVQARFDSGLIGIVSRAQFTGICVIINKQDHLNRYVSPFHPYHYCLGAMLDRYSGWLNHWNAVGDVMAESRGREEDLQLKAAYRRVFESGTLLFPYEHHQRALTSKDIKIRPKVANIAGLQLADILAHPVRQACLAEKGWIPDPGDVFGNRLYGLVKPKLNYRYGTGSAATGRFFSRRWAETKRPLSGPVSRQPLRAVHLRSPALHIVSIAQPNRSREYMKISCKTNGRLIGPRCNRSAS